MNINELMGILNGYFSWNKSRMECFATMLVALIKVRTVNLTEIACGFSSTATQDSRKKKLALIEKVNPYWDDLYEKLM